jgi:DNA-binding transcriptional ArsR family regulator
LQALEWLARVGLSPAEPIELVLGVSERVAHDHVRRLEVAGLVKRVPMRRGQGSLIVLTRNGALEAGYPASRAPRTVTPTTWAHASACAWASAWLEFRGARGGASASRRRQSLSLRRALTAIIGGYTRVTHRPDLAAQVAAGPIAIEVELHRKTQARLYGILSMYADMTDGDEAPLAGVIYITGNDDIDRLVRRLAVTRT